MRSIIFILTLAILFSFFAPTKGKITNNQPIVGILSQPSPYNTQGYPSTNYSYIAGSYIHHLEAAGAHVIPIQWDMPPEDLEDLLSQLNGLYFPGGGWNLNDTEEYTEFQLVGNFLVEQVIKINKKDDYFPLMGVCLGFEMISIAIAQNASLLIYVSTGSDVAKNLYPTEDAEDSLMFEYMAPDLYYNISHEKLAYFHHSFTPDPAAWTTNPYLAENFTLTSWTNNTANTSYVATAEGIHYPIFGSQFHPEKNTYEWYSAEAIPHIHDAIRLQQHMANFFVNQTRKSNHSMLDDIIRNLSIYNYQPLHFGTSSEFEEVYIVQNYNVTNSSIIGNQGQRLREYKMKHAIH